MKLLLLITLCMSCTNAPPDHASAPLAQPPVFTCCGSSDSASITELQRFERSGPTQRPPEVALFPYRLMSDIEVRERIIVEDTAAWSGVWRSITGLRAQSPVPVVDFVRETIAVASMGRRSRGGYTISIESAGMIGDTVLLAVTERIPDRTCGTTGARSAPVAIARVARPHARIRFVERTSVSHC